LNYSHALHGVDSVACGDATTSLQPKPEAEAKKGFSAKSSGSRSSRVGVSSSNLKNKN
jgi:hypothetical protein